MNSSRPNRLRDHAVRWFIVDSLTAELAKRRLTKAEQRLFIIQRLAQEYRIPTNDIQVHRHRTLYPEVSRIYGIANPCSAQAATDLAEARRRGLHYHTCYAIAIGTKTLAEVIHRPARSSSQPRPKLTATQLHRRFHTLIRGALHDGMFIEEVCDVFFDAQAEIENGTDLRSFYFIDRPPK
jgi:hypothetical protein